MNDQPLKTPLSEVAGVSRGQARLLRKLGLQTAEDLLWYLPREIHDLTDVRGVFQLDPDQVQTVFGIVLDVDAKETSSGKKLVKVLLSVQGQRLTGTWFNQPWIREKFAPGQEVTFSGKPTRRYGQWEMSSPKVSWVDPDDPMQNLTIECVYGLTDGLKAGAMRDIVARVVPQYARLVADPLPEAFRRELQLLELSQAIRQVHQPATRHEYDRARQRLVFDDLLEFQLGLAMRRRTWKKDGTAPELPVTRKIDARIRRRFPFEFTAGQNRAIQEVCADLATSQAMHRLLQADVGAGKTVVALYALLVAVAAGYQAAIMAPTEILASQHWQTIERTLQGSEVQRLLLTGSLTQKQRRQALERIECGDVQIVVGTQAIIQQDVQFHRLGVVVIDEQHKFGVMQRAHFSSRNAASPDAFDELAERLIHPREKTPSLFDAPTADKPPVLAPHVLVMTATPIPRSLCLTQFGDLDITAISELPPGRRPVKTYRVAAGEARQRAWTFLREQLVKGRQAYVVCPRVEDKIDEDSPELVSAEGLFKEIQLGELKNFRVGLAHGQMEREQKAAVMEQFRTGKLDVLVCTTVIEVGVDVPNATLMVIFQAERFGLSQLHQLRGRIGRGQFQGYCFLFSDSVLPEALERLTAMEATSDGFEIAETDFRLRGPGDVLGTRQHGELPLRVAHLVRDWKTLQEARTVAFDLVRQGRLDQPEFAPLKIQVLERFGELMNLPKSG